MSVLSMQGVLKTGPFRIGLGYPMIVREAGRTVQITATENHPIYRKRYKILGYDEWFEENCFDKIYRRGN